MSKKSGAAQNEERIIAGLSGAPGIAIGTAHIHDPGAVVVPEYRIPASRIAPEQKRFAEATATAGRQIDQLLARSKHLPPSASEEMGYLLDAYGQMLKGSRLLRGVSRRISEQQVNAEAAVQREIAEIIESFAAMDDTYLAARIDDVREIGVRLVRALTKQQYRPFSVLPKNAVILAEELTPADTALLDPRHVAGLAAELGGVAGHTAIMARSLALPAVLGATGLTHLARNGETVIVDGEAGKVIINPKPETLATYRGRRAAFLKHRRQLWRLSSLPSVTKDGVAISLMANLELPSEVESVLKAGADGIGLLRSEFLFMNRASLPDEDEQLEQLSDIVARMRGKPVVIRTLDTGGEKLPELEQNFLGANPALGLRAIRLSLAKPKTILEPQVAAIMRAGAIGPVRMLLPMISSVEEVIAVRETMGIIAKRLTKKKIPFKMPPLGVMIEIPGAAISADALATHSDFFAIGTNDLTMYTLAIDRSDEQVAKLYNPLHPAVLRLIQFTAEAALRARIPISVCGEMAGDPRYTGLLLGLGIRELSMASVNLPRVKQRVRALDMGITNRRARIVMDQTDSARIASLVDDMNHG
jgi:phosphotransferase system enzyme I (PtsI)